MSDRQNTPTSTYRSTKFFVAAALLGSSAYFCNRFNQPQQMRQVDNENTLTSLNQDFEVEQDEVEEEDMIELADIDYSKEVCSGENCSGYRGKQTKTKKGKTCQPWNSDSPHSHGYHWWMDYDGIDSYYKDDGIKEGNYCRNPKGEHTGLWCFTDDWQTRWDDCDVMKKKKGRGRGGKKPKGCPVTGYTFESGWRDPMMKQFDIIKRSVELAAKMRPHWGNVKMMAKLYKHQNMCNALRCNLELGGDRFFQSAKQMFVQIPNEAINEINMIKGVIKRRNKNIVERDAGKHAHRSDFEYFLRMYHYYYGVVQAQQALFTNLAEILGNWMEYFHPMKEALEMDPEQKELSEWMNNWYIWQMPVDEMNTELNAWMDECLKFTKMGDGGDEEKGIPDMWWPWVYANTFGFGNNPRANKLVNDFEKGMDDLLAHLEAENAKFANEQEWPKRKGPEPQRLDWAGYIQEHGI